MYGVAAYNHWKIEHSDNEVHNVMKSYHDNYYANIPAPPDRSSSNGNNSSPTSLQQRHYMSTRRGNIMANAMDELNSVLMSIQGITPQEAANRRKKQMEEEELKAQEASQEKVMEWMKTTDVSGL
jgi:hypothetical protein